LKLKVQKKVDAFSDRVFEQEIRVGKGVDKYVKVPLVAAQLNVKGKQLQSRQLSLEQAEMKKPGKEGSPKLCRFQPPTLPLPTLSFLRRSS